MRTVKRGAGREEAGRGSVGGGARIQGGVTIGDDAVIGAGSLVTTDVPAGAVAVGSPARAMRYVTG